ECLYELHQMTRPSYRAYRTTSSDAQFPVHIPDFEGLRRAIPHVKSMVAAMRCKDRATALESGQAALAQTNAKGSSESMARSLSRRAESVKIANVVPQDEKLVGKLRPVVGNRRPRRASVPSSS